MVSKCYRQIAYLKGFTVSSCVCEYPLPHTLPTWVFSIPLILAKLKSSISLFSLQFPDLSWDRTSCISSVNCLYALPFFYVCYLHFSYWFIEVFEFLGILKFLLNICYKYFPQFNIYILTLFMVCFTKNHFYFVKSIRFPHLCSYNPWIYKGQNYCQHCADELAEVHRA